MNSGLPTKMPSDALPGFSSEAKPTWSKATAKPPLWNFKSLSIIVDWCSTFRWEPLPGLNSPAPMRCRHDSAKAHTAYLDFFTLWKDADPDIAILKQAKVEFANLR